MPLMPTAARRSILQPRSITRRSSNIWSKKEPEPVSKRTRVPRVPMVPMVLAVLRALPRTDTVGTPGTLSTPSTLGALGTPGTLGILGFLFVFLLTAAAPYAFAQQPPDGLND